MPFQHELEALRKDVQTIREECVSLRVGQATMKTKLSIIMWCAGGIASAAGLAVLKSILALVLKHGVEL